MKRRRPARGNRAEQAFQGSCGLDRQDRLHVIGEARFAPEIVSDGLQHAKRLGVDQNRLKEKAPKPGPFQGS